MDHGPHVYRRWTMAIAALAGLAGTVVHAGCTPERLRPGPPSLTIEVPAGNTVFSPDTLPILIHVRDDNGLDSVTVTVFGETADVDAFDEVEVIDIFDWPIPDGLMPGELVEIQGYAKDLVGERTNVTTSVTVIARPPANPTGR